MKSFEIFFIILFLISSILCQKYPEAKEFEENEINSNFEVYIYKVSKPSMIILKTTNENFDANSDDTRKLIAYNNITKKSEEFTLHSINYFIFEDFQNEESAEYILKFRNYQEGKFIIYNSIDEFPLKDLEKGYNMKYYFSSGSRDINLTFTTEALKEDILLDIYPGEKMKIMKILDTSEEEQIEIKNNSAQLSKDSEYKIEFHENSDKFEIAIKKREIMKYKIDDEFKLNLFNKVPFFFLLKISEYDTEKIYSYMYSIEKSNYNISIAELESENIDNWDNIVYSTEISELYSAYANEINIKDITKPYLLIKYALTNELDKNNFDFFYIFKIFQYYSNYVTPSIMENKKDTLIIEDNRDQEMTFITSNISNIRTFENKQPSNIICLQASYYFPYIVKASNEPFELNSESIYSSLNGKIFFNEKHFRNDLGNIFNTIIEKNVWYYDIDDNYTFIVQSDFGFPKIYYSDDINYEIIKDLKNEKFDNFKQLNVTNNILNVHSPFVLYIQPYESSYLNILLNRDDNKDIIKEIPNKYVYENSEYKLLLAPNKVMIRIDKDFEYNINILKGDEIIYRLNKQNPKEEIEFLNNDLILKSENRTIINFYYNISNLFFDEPMEIITFPPDRKGEIMIVKILSYESNNYYYITDYGYNNYISPSSKKISTTQTFFFIEDPYSKMSEVTEDLRYYLILFNKNIKSEISFKKHYEKPNNLSYYMIESDENHALVSDLNYPKGHFTYEIILCENKNINYTMTDINNKTEEESINEILIDEYDTKSLFTFEAKSKFLFLQKENDGYKKEPGDIKYYIPDIKDGKISILLLNNIFYENNKYSFLLVEDKNNDDNLLNQLDNECYLFSLINNEIKDINFIIQQYSIEKGKYLYEELDYTHFSNAKYLLIKIFSCENAANMCVFSKTQRIYLENLKKDEEEEEFGIKKIEEFTEYKITRQDYIFSYDYKPYINNIKDLMVYITVPATSTGYVGKFEVINPSMQSFTFKYRYTETIPLIKGTHVTSSGRYYFIFRNCPGVSFYVHNTIRFFPLNKINNYISETEHRISNGDGMLYLTMDLEEDKYIYLESNNLNDISLYSKIDKTLSTFNYDQYHAYKIKKGSYLFIVKYSESSNYQFMFNINHYLVNLEKSKEIKVEMGTKLIWEPTVAAVVDLSQHTNSLYIASDSLFARVISCEDSMNIEDIIKNVESGNTYLTSHIQKINEKTQCDPPYYNIKLQTTRFELVSDVYNYDTSQNLTFQQKDTIAFTVEGDGYNLIISDQENLKRLDEAENDLVNAILSNGQIQFKLKPNEDIKTNLQIIILENEKNKEIETLTNKEISTRIKNAQASKEIKYYINLSKNKYVINHFDYIGKLEFYISKEEINGNNLKQILTEDDINMDSFDKITNEYFEMDNNKILIMKKENEIDSELLMTPLIHDFIIENANSKYLIANKKYLIRSNIKILLEENSDAKIKVYDLNNTEIYIIDKDNSFENKDYNKTLFIKSDKDALIYIYHHIEENLKIFEHPKNASNSILILFSSDCENNKLEYATDFGFENYTSNNLERIKLLEYKTIISLGKESSIKIQKGVNHITYMQCEDNAKISKNSSGIFKNSTSNEGNGSYIIEKNKDIYINNILDTNKKNIFYQIFECEQNEETNNEFYASIDGEELNKLNENDNFINGNNKIDFYLKTKDELIFNFYKTGSNKDNYEQIEKNENPKFNITYITKNKTKIDILPKYKNIDFEFYFFMYIDKENKTSENPFKNKCYMKKLINNDKSQLFDENIIIKKIKYKNGKINDNIIDIPNLIKGSSIYSNVLGSAKIFEDVEEYIFYTEQNHIIQDSDIPSDIPPTDEHPSGDEPKGLNGGVIAGIVIGVFGVVLIILFVIFKLRKKNSSDLEIESKNPLISA